MSGNGPSPLDDFIPRPDVRERHSTVVRAPASVVFATALDFDFQSVPLIRAIIRLRERLLGTTRTERRPQPFIQEAQAMGWGILREEPGRLVVAGAHCQPWQADVTFVPVPTEQFRDFQQPDRVKIAWTLEVEPLGPGSARLVTETRAQATDAGARRRFRRYWRWARFGIVAIRWFMLPAIRRRAERRRRFSLGAILFLLCAGCEEVKPTVIPGFETVPVVQVRDLDASGRGVWQTSLVYSTETGGELQVGPEPQALFLADSSLAVGDGSELYLLDPRGRLSRRLGSRGMAPANSVRSAGSNCRAAGWWSATSWLVG